MYRSTSASGLGSITKNKKGRFVIPLLFAVLLPLFISCQEKTVVDLHLSSPEDISPELERLVGFNEGSSYRKKTDSHYLLSFDRVLSDGEERNMHELFEQLIDASIDTVPPEISFEITEEDEEVIELLEIEQRS